MHQDATRRAAPVEMERGPSRTGRKKKVVIHRKVTAAEYAAHRERMETLGLDPSEPVPVGFTVGADEPVERRGSPGTQYRPDFMDPVGQHANTRDGVSGASPAEIASARPSVKVAREPIKKVSLQKRTIEEQIQAERHERALARFAKQQQEWEHFRHHAAGKTGRPKEHLVVSKAEDHRERMEVMELLDRATPDEVKSGGASWYHSLRGEGTRFVQIGNMFSGLYLPIKLHKENVEPEQIRKPLLRELHERRNAVLEQGGTLNTWRDEEVLVQRLRRYGQKMKEISPGALGFHEVLEPDLGVVGRALPSASSDRLQGDDAGGELIDDAERGEIRSNLRTALAPVEEEGTQAELIQGPNIEATPARLQFVTDVNKLHTLSVRLKNVGTASINYEWKLNTPSHAFHESILPDDRTNRFSCDQAKGRILPGREVNTLFTFTSTTAGFFVSSWRLDTYPRLLSTITNVTMHGVANEGDLLLERRQGFCKDVHDQQVLRQVQEIIDDMVESVKLEPAPGPDVNLIHVQERLFCERNADLGLYWSPHAWHRLSELTERVDDLVARTAPKRGEPSKTSTFEPDASRGIDPPLRGRRPVKKPEPPPPPPPPALLAPSPAALLTKLSSVSSISRQEVPDASPAELDVYYAKQELSVDVPRAIRGAQVRPPERSPIWWAAYEVVTELVMSVPRFHAHARKFANVEPMPFITPPDTDAAPEAVAEFEDKMAARRSLREQEDCKEKEAKASESFLKSFSKCRFGPRLEQFSLAAREATVVSSIRDVAKKMPSIRSRFEPYLGRQNTEGVELGGNVVIYEADLDFLASVSSNPEDSRTGFSGEVLEQAKQRFQGLIGVLDGGPLALIVVAHVGTPPPDRKQADAEEGGGDDVEEGTELDKIQKRDAAHLSGVQTRMANLISLEPLVEAVSEACSPLASTVEFVSHEAWLADVQGFAQSVRREDRENKVFLLENMAAIPEELGLLRTIVEPPKPPTPPPEPAAKGKKAAPPPVEEPPPPQEPPDPMVVRFPWAAREGWAERVFKGIQPEILVQDSFASACNSFTLHTGLWKGVPTRVIGPLIEQELAALVEAMPALAPPTGDAAAEDEADEEDDKPAAPSPLMCAIGGGGFSDPKTGEETLLKKLHFLIGVAQLKHAEEGGIILALGGELAVVVLVHILGLRVGLQTGVLQSPAIAAAVRETFMEVLGNLDVPVMLPVDLVCEQVAGTGSGGAAASPTPQAGDAGEGESLGPRPTYSLKRALAAAAGTPKHLGFIDGKELCIVMDPEKGMLRGLLGSPEEMATTVPPPAEPLLEETGPVDAETGDVPIDLLTPVPPDQQVRDIGDATVECLKTALRQCRGILCNGAFGVVEEERWRAGSKALMSFVEARLIGPEEEEEEEEEDEDEDEDGEPKPAKEKKLPDADFEVAVVIGQHSAQHLPSLMETPSALSFVSTYGAALLQIFRGEPLPGLLTCDAAPPG